MWRTERFDRQIAGEVGALFGAVDRRVSEPFSVEKLANLPEPLRSYLRRCVPDGQPAVHSVRLKQTGRMRLKPGQPWRPFQATQYYTAEPLGFVWRVGMAMLPGVRVVGRDTYARQHGHMLIKLYSTLPVVDESGPKIAVGAFVRLIAELVWFPMALVDNPHLQWEAVDGHTVRAVATDGDVRATVTYHFDDQGDLVRVSSLDRFHAVTDAQPTPWYVNSGRLPGIRRGAHPGRSRGGLGV